MPIFGPVWALGPKKGGTYSTKKMSESQTKAGNQKKIENLRIGKFESLKEIKN